MQQSELITYLCIKKHLGYGSPAVYKIYTDLLHDLLDTKGSEEPYTDAYDIVQEIACILCQHIGKRFGTVIGKNKHGNSMTVMQACYNKINRIIYKTRHNANTYKSYEYIPLDKEPCTKFDYEPNSYEDSQEKVDNIIEQMNLTQVQVDTLNCYMSGMTFFKIADFLSVTKMTIWKRRKQIQEKYLAVCDRI